MNVFEFKRKSNYYCACFALVHQDAHFNKTSKSVGISLKLYAFDFRQTMDGFFAQIEQLLAACQKDVAIKQTQLSFHVARVNTNVCQVKCSFIFMVKTRAIFRTLSYFNPLTVFIKLLILDV